ncbi:hypothetical protein Tco_0446774 [Tanacetum coccineum]
MVSFDSEVVSKVNHDNSGLGSGCYGPSGPDCFPIWVGRRPLGRVGQEMGCRLLRLQKDSRKVDIWFLELGLQWASASGGRELRRAAGRSSGGCAGAADDYVGRLEGLCEKKLNVEPRDNGITRSKS